MKKIRNIAHAPILLAGILMLALTVLPHHHHGESLCLNVTHCQKHEALPFEKGEPDDCKSLGHHHDPQHHCSLKEAFVTENTKKASFVLQPATPEFPAIVFCISGTPRINDPESSHSGTEDYLKNPPFIENRTLSFVAEVRVLRAPPLKA